MTLASVVEKETGQPEERPRIAAVFQNRLDRRMPLQTDPTVIYALRQGRPLGRQHPQEGPRHRFALQHLPSARAAARAHRLPGREAILAALHPADTKDLYFVSRNDGSHQFSETLTEHERAVDRYQRSRSARARVVP